MVKSKIIPEKVTYDENKEIKKKNKFNCIEYI